MLSPPFESAGEKLKRANLHIGELKGLVDEFVGGLEKEGKGFFSLSKLYLPRSRCIAVFAVELQPTRLDWGAIVGDVLQNFLAALDHMAWRLVELGREPPDTLSKTAQKRVQFPIYSKRDDFNEWLPKRLPGVERSQQAIVRRYQPFIGGRRKAPYHPFSVLHEFATRDKHRVIQLLWYKPFNVEVLVKKGSERDFVPRSYKGPGSNVTIEPGTELFRAYGRRTGPNPDLEMEILGQTDLALEGGFWLADSLRVIGNTIFNLGEDLSASLP